MQMIKNYDELVYAGVLGKVIGVYMGRPFEGWRKTELCRRWGLVDHYVAHDRQLPLVVADDDITGTFTFVRGLADSGKLTGTTSADYGRLWLNYIIENKSILWWGGVGVSTEHTAYCRLKQGIPAPQSGSMALNGQVVAEQIGAQIFIDAFGLVAPGNPQLAAQLAQPSARVSHDGEAVYAATVVAAMVAAAFTEKNMERLLDIGISVVPGNCLIAQVHRDVRRWAKADGDWHKTFERIEAQYGYDKYGGGCHIIPNHAIMVLAWAYAPDNFRDAMAIICTAGWDTDCNAANVGCVMGVKVGLAGINQDYDFQAPFADRVMLPTAEGTRSISDCLLEAEYIARIGRQIMGWPAAPAAKAGAWQHFGLPGSRHGYMVETTLENIPGTGTTSNVAGTNSQRQLQIDFDQLYPEHPVRVATPIALAVSGGGIYVFMGTPRIYSGQTLTLHGQTQTAGAGVTVKLFVRCFDTLVDGAATTPTKMYYGDAVVLRAGQAFTLTLTVPETYGRPVKDFGLEFNGTGGAGGRVWVDRITTDWKFSVQVPEEIYRGEKSSLPGWIADLDMLWGRDTAAKQRITGFGKNAGIGLLVTGTTDWKDYTLATRFSIHCAEAAGLVARYQGLRRFVGVLYRSGKLQLVRQYDDEETILAETTVRWACDELRALALTVQGRQVSAALDGQEILRGTDDRLGCGGAGFYCARGWAGFRETTIQSCPS